MGFLHQGVNRVGPFHLLGDVADFPFLDFGAKFSMFQEAVMY